MFARNHLTKLFAAFALFTLATVAQAQSAARQQAWQRFVAINGVDWQAVWSSDGQRIVRLHGLTAPMQGSAELVAKNFLAANADVLGLVGQLGNLKLTSQRRSLGSTHLMYQQTIGRLPVFNEFLDIHVNESGQVYLVHNPLLLGGIGQELNLQPKLTSAQAVEHALAVHASHRQRDKWGRPLAQPTPGQVGLTEMGIYKLEAAPHLAYRLTVDSVRYTVDAATGDVLETHDAKGY